jgi:iron complex outermembrane receptor protein
MNRLSLPLAGLVALTCQTFTQAAELSAGNLESRPIEMVLVTGVRRHRELPLEVNEVMPTALDNSDLLRQLPGANRNANGPLTRISQYRGLFGAHNNVLVDGQSYTPGGPNWMDPPLSSIPQALTSNLTLYRGLGSVDVHSEGLGTTIAINSRQGDFGPGDAWQSFGQVASGYASNASAWNASAQLGMANQQQRWSIAASEDRGDNYAFDGGKVVPSEYERRQYRADYGFRGQQVELAAGLVVNRTGPSGTPALPMDILLVDSEQYRLEADTPLAGGELRLRAGVMEVDHVMDNFTLRPVPLNPMGMPNFRQSDTSSSGRTAAADWALERGDSRWQLGFDTRLDEHDALISNPRNAMFFIDNFKDIQRDRFGLYAMFTTTTGSWDHEAGLRYNRVEMDAGMVAGNLAAMPGSPMAIQQQRLDQLALEFNNAQRRQTDDHWIALFKASRALGEHTRLDLGLGRKMRSPSYQQRYLWLPLEATSGLADLQTYLGTIDLKPEASLEATVGLDWSANGWRFSPELFYRDVSDFILGVPSTNATANAFAMMMGGSRPLQFANVDATLYGIDLGYQWQINTHLQLRGNLGYVRGERNDTGEPLYRIAPLSSWLELAWETQRWRLATESVAAAGQDRVALYNDEQTTPGWGIINLRSSFELSSHFSLAAGVENLFDRAYQDHLGGYNRVRDVDVAQGSRLPAAGRNYYLSLNAHW